ncbi:hypothetical protein P3G55_13995 [Leptospira sp. 96542]|nr:hypothetical protein [Leptospira sp. 96542]
MNLFLIVFAYLCYTICFLFFLPISFRIIFPLPPIISLFIILYYQQKNIFHFFQREKWNLSLTLFFTLIFFYLATERWDVEPYGMWDSWANWNLKAKSITAEFLNHTNVKMPMAASIHPEYPIGLPILIASFMILFGSWWIPILYTMQILFVFGTCYLLIKNTKSLMFKSITILILLTNINFLNIVSDLCADLLLSFLILWAISNLHNLEPTKTNSSIFFMGLQIASLSLFKFEGLAIFILFTPIVFIRFFIFQTTTVSLKKILLYVVGTIVPTILFLYFYNLTKVNGISDFSISSFSDSKTIFSQSIDKIPFIWIYFFEFHFHTWYGLYFISIILSFLSFDKITLATGFFLFSILIFYNLIYFFSSQNISWHLSTSYTRIHITLLPSFLWLIGKVRENSFSNILPKVLRFM